MRGNAIMRWERKLMGGWLGMLASAAITIGWADTAAGAAGTASVTGSTLTFRAGLATRNNLAVSAVPSSEDRRGPDDPQPQAAHFRIDESGMGATLQAATGCTQDTGGLRVFCVSGPVAQLVFMLGDSGDKITLVVANVGPVGPTTPKSIAIPTRINGGPGHDDLTGGSASDVLVAGPGRNSLRGGDGDDRLETRNRSRDALIDCGEGAGDTAIVDRLDPEPVGCETVQRPQPAAGAPR